MPHPVFNPGEQVNIGLALENGKGENSIQGNIGITKQHRNNTGESSAHIFGGYQKTSEQISKNIGFNISNTFHTAHIQGIANLQLNATEQKILQTTISKIPQYQTIQNLCIQLNTELQGKTKGGLIYQMHGKYLLQARSQTTPYHMLNIGGKVQGNINKIKGMCWFLSGDMMLDSNKSNATQYHIKTGLEQKLQGKTIVSFGLEYDSKGNEFKPTLQLGIKKTF